MSEHPKLPDIVERIDSALGLLDPSIKYGGTMTDLHLLRACKAEIERLRTRWEKAREAAAKVADETAALEDKHDRYEGWRAAHHIAQTIRSSLLRSSGRDGRKP